MPSKPIRVVQQSGETRLLQPRHVRAGKARELSAALWQRGGGCRDLPGVSELLGGGADLSLRAGHSERPLGDLTTGQTLPRKGFDPRQVNPQQFMTYFCQGPNIAKGNDTEMRILSTQPQKITTGPCVTQPFANTYTPKKDTVYSL